MNPVAPFSTAQALRFGWDKTLANLKPLVILGIAGALLNLMQQSLARSGGIGGLLALGVQLLHAGAALLLVRACLDLHDGAAVHLERWREQLPRYLPWLLTLVVYGCIVAGGTLLLIVPGVIWAVQYGFAPFLCVDRGLDPISALRESGRLTRGNRSALFLFGLVCLAVNLAGALALGVGLLVTVPTTLIATAHVMRALQQRAGSDVGHGQGVLQGAST